MARPRGRPRDPVAVLQSRAVGVTAQGYDTIKWNPNAAAIEGTRGARLNSMHRPKSLLSGLLFCGCCGGSFSRRGQGRFACSSHADNNSCSNSRTIARDLIEARVLDGLRDKLDKLMAPEIATEAVRVRRGDQSA